jgi:lipid-A-disaccharide synthase
VKIALVAGESSGDTLGAALITAVRARVPEVEFRGVAGPAMRTAGCETLADAHELAVMGLIEPLKHLPRLLALRSRLVREISAWQPDVFVGIDAPGFNLGLAHRLKRRGLRTVQYVSPQVWAWREGRVRGIAAGCDLVLCLLPFEVDFYRRHAVSARFVGHPLADAIALPIDRAAARARLGLAREGPVVALLPGSRVGEVERLGSDFIEAARSLARSHPGIRFLAPMATAATRALFERQQAERVAGDPASSFSIEVLDGQARVALCAADAALVASGTASLEAMLCDCPMVVAYRFGALTAFLLRALRLVRLPYFSLPNLLAQEKLAPEFFQSAATPENLVEALRMQMEDQPRREYLRRRFEAIHETLAVGGAARAAEAVLQLARGERPGFLRTIPQPP